MFDIIRSVGIQLPGLETGEPGTVTPRLHCRSTSLALADAKPTVLSVPTQSVLHTLLPCQWQVPVRWAGIHVLHALYFVRQDASTQATQSAGKGGKEGIRHCFKVSRVANHTRPCSNFVSLNKPSFFSVSFEKEEALLPAGQGGRAPGVSLVAAGQGLTSGASANTPSG